MVGGVSPGKGGNTHLNLPVFNTTHDAVEQTGAEATMIYVPAPGAADAILEAADAGVKVIICITEGIPVNDMIKVKATLREQYPDAVLVGPNRSEEHTSELQSLMRISYAVFCLKKKNE